MDEKDTQRIVAHIPTGQHTALKVKLTQQGKTISDFMRECVERELSEEVTH